MSSSTKSTIYHVLDEEKINTNISPIAHIAQLYSVIGNNHQGKQRLRGQCLDG